MTETEKKEYYADIKEFQDKGFKTIVIPHKAWEVLKNETLSQNHYCISDKGIPMVKIDGYYLFPDVEESYGDYTKFLTGVMAMGISKDESTSEYLKKECVDYANKVLKETKS